MIRLMTYNIRLGIQQGLTPIAEHISRQNADIVALQEVGDRWVMGPSGDTTRELAERLNMPYALHVATILRRRSARYGHALLSRWPLSNTSVKMLPRVKDERRALLMTTAETPYGPLRLITTHLSWLAQDRPKQGKILVKLAQEHIDGQTAPLLVMGDLNEDNPDAPWLLELKSLMRDADAPLDRKTFPAKAPRVRIDFLLSSVGAWNATDTVEDAAASDHYALASTLDLAAP
jgi:endonuclease/exonuclease/phosphatase family metal-dependent hydrolase